jgi:alpha-beta hydrolase superfamily lysophospholipase/uncharacterized protein (UPF0147 family)
MDNMIAYLKWRGDLTFDTAPLCEADYLVFSQLAYITFDGIVSDSPIPQTTVGKAAKEAYEKLYDSDKKLIRHAENMLFLQEIITSPRFSELPICAYVDILNKEKEEQFSAVTFFIPEKNDLSGTATVVAFRGTDANIIGWKEDFNMAFSTSVPAQLDAVKYLEKVAKEHPLQRLYVCGHSKGGNLAVYAAAFCSPDIRDRIIQVRSLDGPGFSRETIETEGFREILDKTQTVVPSSSVVGILLEHAESFTVIRSYATEGPFQHDPFTWEIKRDSFVYVEEITDITKYIDSTTTRWLQDMDSDLREKFINGLFKIFSETGTEDIRELFTPKNLIVMARAIKNLDTETSKALSEAALRFRNSAKQDLPTLIKKLAVRKKQPLDDQTDENSTPV